MDIIEKATENGGMMVLSEGRKGEEGEKRDVRKRDLGRNEER